VGSTAINISSPASSSSIALARSAFSKKLVGSRSAEPLARAASFVARGASVGELPARAGTRLREIYSLARSPGATADGAKELME
jgi:hypothetical protein